MMYELPLKAYFVHSSEATITLSVNPSLQAATQSWVNARYATKQELTDAVAAVVENVNKPPFFNAPGLLPEGGPVFIDGTGNYQLKVAPENSLLEITVLNSDEAPTLSAPGTEKIKTIKGEHALIRLISKNRLYRFKRENNQWRQL
jgi:hypothetical protein